MNNHDVVYQAVPIDLNEYFSQSGSNSILPSFSVNRSTRASSGINDSDRKKLYILGALICFLILTLMIVLPVVHHLQYRKQQKHAHMTISQNELHAPLIVESRDERGDLLMNLVAIENREERPEISGIIDMAEAGDHSFGTVGDMIELHHSNEDDDNEVISWEWDVVAEAEANAERSGHEEVEDQDDDGMMRGEDDEINLLAELDGEYDHGLDDFY